MMQRKTTRFFVGLAAAVALGLVAALPASALEVRPNTFSFGPNGTEPTPVVGQFFGGPGDIAFHAPDRLYLTNSSGSGTVNGIFGFNPASAFEPVAGFTPRATDAPGGTPGLAVDTSGEPTDGNIYLASQSTDKVYAFDSAGNALWTVDPRISPGAPEGKTAGGSLDLRGIAVDSDGTVWVSNTTTHYVLKYSPAGTYLGAVNVGTLAQGSFNQGNVVHIDFDSADNLFLEIQSNAIYKLAAPAYDQTAATVFEGGANPFPINVTVNRTNNHVFVTRSESIREYDSAGTLISTFGTNVKYGNETENFQQVGYRDVAINSATDQVYVSDSPFGGGAERLIRVFGPVGIVPNVTTGEKVSATRTTITVKGHVELAGGGPITSCKVQAGTTNTSNPERSGFYDVGTFPCDTPLPINSDSDVTATIEGVEPEDSCEQPSPPCKRQRIYYRFVAGNETGPDTGTHKYAYPEPAIKDIDTLPATEVGLDSVEMNGHFDRDGYETKYYFQWTTTFNDFQNYAQYTSIQQSAPAPGPVANSDEVHFSIPGGLEHGKTYYYRVVASNETGITFGDDETFYTSSGPTLLNDHTFVSHVSTDQATIHLTGNPNGLLTTYHIEYGTEGDCASNPCISLPEPEIVLGAGVLDADNTFQLTGLEPDTKYHYRVVMTNAKGTVTNTTDHLFKTFAHNVIPTGCPNHLVRQQTGAALLMDCRAFELVSAADTGGYDVESSLAPGETPYAGYPYASGPSQVLYGIHNGAIPGMPGNPTNKGIDPYVATRGNDGWTTKYVGIPANGTPSAGPFSSSLLAADPGLDTFAFGGSDICAPCFPNGATGIPMRMLDGSLVQGMAGQEDPGAAAAPDGLVTKSFSGDGSHFVFGSVLPYQADGNNTGDVSIYDRDLKTGLTQVVSKTPAGTNLPCLQGLGNCHSPGNTNGIAQLDISSDGSRIVVGQLIDEDDAGNDFYHLYMHIGTDTHTIDLTPGTTSGVHFDGMTSDGSKVYFTTRDKLTTAASQDTDESVDLFRATVDQGGATALTRVSTGIGIGNGSGNYDGCDPSGNSGSPDDWNTISGGPTDCSVVAVGGGGGVAAGDGTVYFLSPERLDGEGEDGSPNLFVAAPGSAPEFVTTLASNTNQPFAPKRHLLDYELTGFAVPSAAAIDHATGEYYVMDNSWRYPFFQENEPPSFVQKFNPAGKLIQSFGTAGKIDGSDSPTGFFRQLGKISGNAAWAAPDSIAVDNTCADQNLTGGACTGFDPSNGSLYVPDRGNNVVDKFDSDGNYISQIDVTEIVGTINVQVNGVEVDPATGNVFVEVTGGNEGGGVLIYDNQMNNAYTGEKFATNALGNAVDMAIDSAGDVYLTTTSFSPPTFVRKYEPPYSNSFSAISVKGVSGIAYDPVSDHLFFDTGDQIGEYTTAGAQVGPSFGSETLKESYSLDAFDERLVVSNKGPTHSAGKFSIFTEPRIPPDRRHDDAIAIDGVNDADTRHTEDFQVTTNGDFSVFGSAVELTEYKPGSHSELYRFNEPGGTLDCVSCPSTNAEATGDASLAANGLNLTDDGRVFFTSTEPLVLRDTNSKEDVYEWKNGEVQPISPGSDQFGSRLLTVTADGVDAHFFTHASLVPQDRNGNQAKIYDARENGGFFLVPEQPPCVASDECHGPGTRAAPSPDIGSFGGTPTHVTPPPACRRGKVRRNGKCVPRKHRKRHHKRHGNRKRG